MIQETQKSKFKEWFNKHYLDEKQHTYSWTVFYMLLFMILTFITLSLWFFSLAITTNNFIQKVNVCGQPIQVSLTGEESYTSHFQELEVKVPLSSYIFFGLSIVFFLSWIEYIVILFSKYIKARKKILYGNSLIPGSQGTGQKSDDDQGRS